MCEPFSIQSLFLKPGAISLEIAASENIQMLSDTVMSPHWVLIKSESLSYISPWGIKASHFSMPQWVPPPCFSSNHSCALGKSWKPKLCFLRVADSVRQINPLFFWVACRQSVLLQQQKSNWTNPFAPPMEITDETIVEGHMPHMVHSQVDIF